MADGVTKLGDLEYRLKQTQQKIAKSPHNPVFQNQLGIMLGAAGRIAEALSAFDRALSFCATFGEAWLNRALALELLGRPREAYDAARQACALVPRYRDAEAKAGALAQILGLPPAPECWPDLAPKGWRKVVARFVKRPGEISRTQSSPALDQAETEESLRSAIAGQTGGSHAVVRLGVLLARSERLIEAEHVLRYGLAADPASAAGAVALADILESTNRGTEAATVLETVLHNGARDPIIMPAILRLNQITCTWRDYDKHQMAAVAALQTDPGCCDPFTALSITPSPQDHLASATHYAAKMQREIVPLPASRRTAAETITVGYMSADFHQHAVATLAADMFALHDRRRFKILGYGLWLDDGGPLRQRIRKGCDRFTELYGKSGHDAAHIIAADKVDILVDLTGYTLNGRPDILAHRPAPLQVNYLGYPGTLGAAFCDYIIADSTVAPATEAAWFSEKIVHLPDAYQINDRKRALPAVPGKRADHGLPSQGVVFCCFNGNAKITPAMFDIWMRILQRVPGSVLWLMGSTPQAEQNLAREAESRGVAAERLVFASKRPYADHIARYHHADLFLDTLPYNAHTTCSEALWLGCPVLTCSGEAFAGRVAASLVRAAGRADLVTGSLEDYEAHAVQLGLMPEALNALRIKIQRDRQSCALFDTPAMTRHIEEAFAHMMTLHREGRAPQAFAVERPS